MKTLNVFGRISDEEWPLIYAKVIADERFMIFGLKIRDLLDLSFYLECLNKTPQELKKSLEDK